MKRQIDIHVYKCDTPVFFGLLDMIVAMGNIWKVVQGTAAYELSVISELSDTCTV